MKGQTQTQPKSTQAGKAKVLVLNKDLFFGVKIGNVLRAQGYDVVFQPVTGPFIESARADRPGLGIIDLNAGPDWEAIAKLTSDEAADVPILVFGSHLDVDGLRAAKAAGVTRVVSNGEFHRNMVDLVNRYLRRRS